MRGRMLAIVSVGVAGAAVALAVTASASARIGGRTFGETYPVAFALCTNAHPGTLPAKLQPQAAAVITACETLENAFAPLVSTVDAAESAYLGTVSVQKALVAAACPQPVTDAVACAGARATARSAVATARTTERTAVATYRAAIEANRGAFWSTIQPLRGPRVGTRALRRALRRDRALRRALRRARLRA